MKTLDVDDYAGDISLFEEFMPAEPCAGKIKNKIVDHLLHKVEHAITGLGPLVSNNVSEGRELLSAAINVLEPGFLDKKSIRLLSSLLQSELLEKKVTLGSDIAKYAPMTIKGTRIALWHGDITTLNTSAIVNAANNMLLGCFQPLHRCIDNIIHSRAGIQLRDDCHKIMRKQGCKESTGTAKITRAYNLPSTFVIHTVGPIVHGALAPHHVQELEQCYQSCLTLCKTIQQINSIAFCCISTGVFGYPHKQAAETAITTVCKWLHDNPGELDYIIFNVFSNRDKSVYTSLLDRIHDSYDTEMC